MGKNNRMPKKQVRDIKGPPEKREVPVNHTNAPILTVQLLNAILDRLDQVLEKLDGRP